MKSLEERIADRIARNAANRAENGTSPAAVKESGESDGGKGKKGKGKGKDEPAKNEPATDLAGAGGASPGWGAAS
jgi:hypothetical protein